MTTETHKLILLVDDDHDCLEVSRMTLEAAGYRVVACYGPDEALAEMQHSRPDLIITDLMMNALDAGFSFARRVREDARYQAVPVIVLTAVGRQLGLDFRPRSREDLQAMHVDAYLDKPARPDTLLATVRELLKQK